jgi:hypothetical protein
MHHFNDDHDARQTAEYSLSDRAVRLSISPRRTVFSTPPMVASVGVG